MTPSGEVPHCNQLDTPGLVPLLKCERVLVRLKAEDRVRPSSSDVIVLLANSFLGKFTATPTSEQSSGPNCVPQVQPFEDPSVTLRSNVFSPVLVYLFVCGFLWGLAGRWSSGRLDFGIDYLTSWDTMKINMFASFSPCSGVKNRVYIHIYCYLLDTERTLVPPVCGRSYDFSQPVSHWKTQSKQSALCMCLNGRKCTES